MSVNTLIEKQLEGNQMCLNVTGVFYRYIQVARVRGSALKLLKQGLVNIEPPYKYIIDSKEFQFRTVDVLELISKLNVLIPQYRIKLNLVNIHSFDGLHRKVDPSLIRDANVEFHAFKKQNILFILDAIVIFFIVSQFYCPALLADLVSQGLARNIKQKQFLRLLQVILKYLQKQPKLEHKPID